MIEMIAGVFGLPVKKDGQKVHIIGKGPNDGPFSATPEQEARLVAKGLARYVSEPIAEVEGEQDMTPIGFDEIPPEDFADDTAEDEAEVEGEQDMTPIGFDEIPPEDFADDTAEDEAEVEGEEIVDLATLSAKELRELGKEYGLSFKANASKVSMIEAITAAQAELDELAEDAPAFDAAEAVL